MFSFCIENARKSIASSLEALESVFESLPETHPSTKQKYEELLENTRKESLIQAGFEGEEK